MSKTSYDIWYYFEQLMYGTNIIFADYMYYLKKGNSTLEQE